jgi:membrane protease YdiL (CAAX protease family)
MKKLNKTFLVLTMIFIISYLLAGLFYIFVGKLKTTSGFVMSIVYMFIPMISVLIVDKFLYREKIVKSLNISFQINKWFFVAWLIMPIIGFMTFGISLLFPNIIYTPGMEGIMKQYESIMKPEQLEQMKMSMETLPIHPIWIVLFQGLLAGLTVNAIVGFGEELSWRGFLIRQFSHMSFIKASIIIGFIWGIWHAPLILMGHNYPQHPQIGVIMMIIWCVLFSPIFLYITLKSKSVIAASIMHGTLNGTAGIALLLIDGGNDLIVGITGLTGFIALILTSFGLYCLDRWIIKEKVMQNKIGNNLQHGI